MNDPALFKMGLSSVAKQYSVKDHEESH